MDHARNSQGPGPERRRHPRRSSKEPIGVSRVLPVLPVSDAEVIDISANGIAIRTRLALKPGTRLSFSTGGGRPPILAEVLATESQGEGFYRVRCHCLLGGFET